MKREWKPGDVAMVRWSANGGWRDEVAIRTERQPVGHVWQTGFGWLGDFSAKEVRPLVVIDFEDDEQVERLAVAFLRQPLDDIAVRMKAALREFTNPTPRIEEPTGLGAVVETERGEIYVRDKTTTTVAHWKRARGEEQGQRHRWSEINAVRVLSPGVEVPQ